VILKQLLTEHVLPAVKLSNPFLMLLVMVISSRCRDQVLRSSVAWNWHAAVQFCFLHAVPGHYTQVAAMSYMVVGSDS
jgi:hypothetical protein